MRSLYGQCYSELRLFKNENSEVIIQLVSGSYGQGYYKALLLSNENSGVFISKFRCLLTSITRTYLDRKEKTVFWTYFLFFHQIKIAPGGIIVT